MIIALTIITFFSTLLGGIVGIRIRDKLQLTLGFSAGAVIGVAYFDLLPEALTIGKNYFQPQAITTAAALGFLIYMIFDRVALLHFHSSEAQMKNRRNLGAGSLSIHSFFDGIAIGLAFHISRSAGFLVAIAVIAHDFSDGLNTVSIVLKNKGRRHGAYTWLFVDSIAPVTGVISTFFFRLPAPGFAGILALLSGFFFYIGASDLLPESQHEHPSDWTTVMTILGITLIYTVNKLSNL